MYTLSLDVGLELLRGVQDLLGIAFGRLIGFAHLHVLGLFFVLASAGLNLQSWLLRRRPTLCSYRIFGA